MKYSFLKVLLAAFLVNFLIAQPLEAVNFQDFRTPIIQELKQSIIPVFDQNENFLDIEYELKVKTFSNPLSGISFAFTYEQKDYPAGCQLLSRDFQPFRFKYGGDPIKLDSLTQPVGLLSTEMFDGYQIEKHKFRISTKSLRSDLNTKFKFCDHILKLDYMSIWDTAGHSNQVLFNKNNYYNSEFFNRFPNQTFQVFNELFTSKPISGTTCSNLSVPYEWFTSDKLYNFCNHTDSLSSLVIALSSNLNDEAIARVAIAAAEKAAAAIAAEKAAAEKSASEKVEIRVLLDSIAGQISSLKLNYGYTNTRVQQETLNRLNQAFAIVEYSGYSEIRLLAQKVQLELMALEQTFAKEKKALKKSTIICVKGKITKKVTAISPKCPAGYKKK